ncbi:hypothetical protein HL666_11305 [Bradyrhizobium sp. 83002]|uniref:hypothetical protein n=1 Tax=Bradyrhizobium aeschynomenes TaxID=2734909 RepID=UPI001554FBAD|nr:hypothetical protein [Bradyrhizobium aeschynomenes]NPU11354.1 hypothetical protein [Bradyrhizobium aeschynomenes]
MKAIIVAYLTIWTTAVASLAVLMIRPLYPELYTSVVRIERDILELLPALTPFIAFPIAFGQAMSVVRRRNTFDEGMLIRYFVGTPICIFFTLLAAISLLTLIFAPIAFILGLTYGAIPLLVGVIIHCFGMLPLYFLDRWLRSSAKTVPAESVR